MILKPIYSSRFQKDLKKYRNSKFMTTFKEVIKLLIKNTKLDKKHCDHKLKGYIEDLRECHVKPDWLIIYTIDKENKTIIFKRTGSHTELFDKKK